MTAAAIVTPRPPKRAARRSTSSRGLDDEPHVVERARPLHVRAVQGEVVRPRREIDVVGVGLPHHGHAEALAVEALARLRVAHVEREVAQPEEAHGPILASSAAGDQLTERVPANWARKPHPSHTM